MKTVFAFLPAFFFTLAAGARILNPGFENGRDSARNLPAHWTFEPSSSYQFTIDDKVRHSGSGSLRITHTPQQNGPVFAPFSQRIEVSVSTLQKVDLTVWVKAENITPDEGGLWCMLLDGKDQTIGFQNLAKRQLAVQSSADWTEYRLRLTLGTDCKALKIGGRLGAGGTIWYDDFSISEPIVATAPPTKEARQYAEKVCRLVRGKSLYRDELKWDSLNRDVEFILAGATGYNDATAVTDYLISKLRVAGDNHSFLLNATRSQQQAKRNVDKREPATRMISPGTAYIYVPGCSTFNKDAMEDFARDIQDGIRRLDSAQPVDRWIVDLRQNTGGNMYPMIAGLGPLIGEGEIGAFVTPEYTDKWFYKNGQCGAGKQTELKIRNPYRLKSATPKIAVLIGDRTGSSGEMTTIAFLGKSDTRLFGQPTYGAITANGMFKLPDGSNLMLASSYSTDRNGKAYKSKIHPDELIDKDSDALEAATKWLGKQ